MAGSNGRFIIDRSIGNLKLNLEAPTLEIDPIRLMDFAGTTINGQAFALGGDLELDKDSLGLDKVANIAPSEYPVSQDQQAEFNKKIAFGTITEFNSTFDTLAKAFYVTDKGKEGLFVYDPNDVASVADDVLVLVRNNKRYKRIHFKTFYPSWWGIDETGTTTSGQLLNKMSSAAKANNADIQANGNYLIDEPYVNNQPFNFAIQTNLFGRGTFKTRNNATINYLGNNITVTNITVDGYNGASNSGRGIFNDGWSNGVAFNVKVINTVGQGFWWRGTDNAHIFGCTTKNNTGASGDGIYVSQAVNVNLHDNTCTEFQRIGIAVEGSDTNLRYSTDVLVNDNIVKDAIPSALESQNYPNGGIWLENVAGCTVTGNRVENTYFRGIAVTPSLTSPTKRAVVIKGNTTKGMRRIDAASSSGYGINCSYAENCSILITDNIMFDCQRYIGVGGADSVLIDNCVFDIDEDAAEDISCLITVDYIRDATATKRTKVSVSNCKNNIVGLASGKGFFFPNVNNQQADLEVRDCKGDFSLALTGTQQIQGNFTFINCLLDWSGINQANATLFNISGKVLFRDCEVKLTGSLFPACAEIEFNNTYCHSDVGARWTQWLTGALKIRILNGSFFDFVHFYDIRRPGTEIYLKNSRFENYPASQGLFVNTVSLAERLEVDGCRFSETNVTTSPLSFATGVNNVVIGENFYATNALVNINGTPVYKQYRNFTIGNTQKPATPLLGHEHYDGTVGFIKGDGTKWRGTAATLINNSAIAPTKDQLNTAYGVYFAGTQVAYPNHNGGPKIYTKLVDAADGNWMRIAGEIVS